ncbi:hypothetical protein C488_14967 [Natrinema pellirubrum DSM 15624]|uniref:DUF8154 domain-containing protein n=1 Tax=Natrinema pellirubrum (strain DSM 15624 / CIP 106293 / JCM 10476 / NCIMB 786 / 157) TaxID=797303 RepID=L0JJQ9_NATP1|nr:hypothetical protein [Natrinema pellirubrum]AGB31770.1 hypothetical protein Natpe_1914 [Natrinema pellirubrum DSM 15624]ELY72614.1 hypothetical protein C488_14967 [Natrinema pellirubrum DSM 15624]
MTSNELEAALGDAEDAFQWKPQNPEVGLEHVSDPAALQLRKSCRLLDAAGFLLDRNGHFTVIIESSFVAIERSIQFYVEEKGYDVAGQRHTDIYKLGVQAGLFSRDVADRLEELWRENRSESYYRTGVAGEYRAQTIYELAVQLHDEIVQLTRTRDCLCE